ncbi:MAG: gfo/Idh/MocA family oxidoreductase [Verrucomicrobia bacterium]|nr:gfo/Idh/MocA family oxidoreductase [Verrucomicrobiota bacterium]
MNTLTRRSFLKSSLITTAALSVPARFWAAVPGANEDIRVAVVGFGGRGGSHISAFSNMKGANHWHSLITVWACQAGKDVYVEKPVSHNVFEGRKCVEASRKYNRIVQAGTQSRSSASFPEAWAWIKEGHIGKIKVARGLCYKPRQSIGKVDGPQPIPANIDYDLWCGPALKLPLMRKKLHYDWHWVWNTGCGDMGNQGIHEMDKCRWALGKMELPESFFSIGGRLGYVDDGETANTQMCVYNYGDVLLIFETRGLPRGKEFQEKGWSQNMDNYRDERIGQVIECEGGYTNGHVACDKKGKQIEKFGGKGDSDHFANFIKAVRSRKRADQNADILEGHLSSALCHLGNISHRVGQEADPDQLQAALKKDSAPQETLARMEEHLAANGVDIKKTKLTLGPTLKFDPKTERFIGNDRANELITRPYRPGFVVPEKV